MRTALRITSKFFPPEKSNNRSFVNFEIPTGNDGPHILLNFFESNPENWPILLQDLEDAAMTVRQAINYPEVDG